MQMSFACSEKTYIIKLHIKFIGWHKTEPMAAVSRTDATNDFTRPHIKFEMVIRLIPFL